jgi:hypothetical protein
MNVISHPSHPLRQNLLALLAPLLLLTALPAPLNAQVFRGYYPSGELQFTAKKERTKETIKGYYPGGALQFVASYRRGRLDGVTREYYENGMLKAEITYERGDRDGLAKFYYETGIIMCKIEYRNDHETGHTRFYDRNGIYTTRMITERPRLRHRRANEERQERAAEVDSGEQTLKKTDDLGKK